MAKGTIRLIFKDYVADLENVRKSLRGSLTPKQRRGLMYDRFVLLKRERDLTDQEQLLLSGWTRSYDELGDAYKLKEDFFKIYDAQSFPCDEAWVVCRTGERCRVK